MCTCLNRMVNRPAAYAASSNGLLGSPRQVSFESLKDVPVLSVDSPEVVTLVPFNDGDPGQLCLVLTTAE